jgi:hypothetical protein
MSRSLQHLMSALAKSEHASPRTRELVRLAIARFISLQALRRAA